MIPCKPLPFLLISLSLVSPIHAQISDWSIVEQLAPGTPISVVVRHQRDCTTLKVTASNLVCNQHNDIRDRRLVLPRERVREVRLEQPDRDRLVAGCRVGAVAGGLVGALGAILATDPETRGYSGVYGVPLGAIAGAVIGSHLHHHGPVLYQRR